MTERAYQALASIEQRAVEYVLGLLSERLKTDDTAWPVIEQVYALGPAQSLVAEFVDLFVQMEVNKAELHHYGKVFAKPIKDEERRPNLDGSDAKLIAAIDEGFVGTGWRPSEKYNIGLAATTLPRTWRKWAFDTARQRYREGFYADPFTNNPIERLAA